MSSSSTSLSRACAYIGMVLAALLVLVTFILQAIGGSLGSIMGVMHTIKIVALALAIGIGAYEFAAAKRKAVYMIFFWIALVVYLLFDFYGIGVNYWGFPEWFKVN